LVDGIHYFNGLSSALGDNQPMDFTVICDDATAFQ